MYFFFRRYGSSALHTRYYDSLRYIRQRIFRLQSRRRTAKRAYTGANIIFNSEFIKPVHLFTNCTVNTRITSMQTHNIFSVPLFHHVNNFIKIHFRTVINFSTVFCIFQKLGINKRTGINNNICIFQKFFSAYSYKIGCTAARSNKMYHFISFPKYRQHQQFFR